MPPSGSENYKEATDGPAHSLSGSHTHIDVSIRKRKIFLIGKTSSHISKFYGRPRWDQKEKKKKRNNNTGYVKTGFFFKLAQKWPYLTQQNCELSWVEWGREEKYLIIFLI